MSIIGDYIVTEKSMEYLYCTSHFYHCSPGSINMRWLVYMKQTCGTSVEDVHKMTMDAMESSDNPALGAVKVEAVENVVTTQIVGE